VASRGGAWHKGREAARCMSDAPLALSHRPMRFPSVAPAPRSSEARSKGLISAKPINRCR
jgi:hypothetical protein